MVAATIQIGSPSSHILLLQLITQQINVYAFKRIRSGPYKGFYRHPDFSRNNVSMAHKLQRKKQRSEMPDHLPQGERDGLALPTAEASEERSLVGYGEPSINECCMAPLMHHITSPALCSSPERDVIFPKQFQFFCQEEKQAHGETDTSGVDFEIGSKLNDMAGASPAALHERSTKTSQPSSVFMSGGPFLASTVHNQGTEDHEVTKTNSLRAGRLTTTELSMFANLDWTDVLDMDEITANSDTCTGASSSSMAMVSATDVSEMSSSTSSLSWVDDDDESVVTIDDFSDLAMLEKDSMFEPLDIFPSFPSTFGHGAAVHV